MVSPEDTIEDGIPVEDAIQLETNGKVAPTSEPRTINITQIRLQIHLQAIGTTPTTTLQQKQYEQPPLHSVSQNRTWYP